MNKITFAAISTFDPPLLLVKTSVNGGEEILKITTDGDILININGEMHKIEDKKEIGYAFALTISKMIGFIYDNDKEEEMISKIVSYYRDKQIDKLL